jgi:hypothetical protein
MKKIIRVLGISVLLVVLGALGSCSKDDDSDSNLPEVTPSSLAGSYKISIAMVDTAVDSNNDGFASQDLLLEGYNACEYDNVIEITQNTFSIIKKGASCNADEKNEIYEYKFDETSKTLVLYENGKVIETLKKVYLNNDNNQKKLHYDRFDSFLNQTVYFKLTKI